MTVHKRTCPLCEAMCGLCITVEPDDAGEQHVKLIRPNRDDVWSKGYICPKGTTLGHMHHDPDRLTVPMIRDGTEWREATWDEAFARCEELLLGVRERHGSDAVSYYIGNPTVHNLSLGRYVGMLTGLSGVKMGYSAGTVDQWPKNVSNKTMYGNSWSIATPDIDRTDHLIVMGANPQASQGSLLSIPDILGALDAVRERGGKVVVIDPRRTKTCEHADEWIPIVPGTDAALLLAMVQVLADDRSIDLGALEGKVNGLDELLTLAADWTPEAVASTCGIPADRICRLARDFAAAERGVVYGRIGTCNQEFGTLASWLVDVVNIVTANFDTPGGLMFGRPIPTVLALQNWDEPAEPEFGRWSSRVRGAPEVLGQVPVSCLAEEIDTPGAGQIRALVTVAGNPVISAPNVARLDAALPELECMISIDNWLNETTRHAHVILPGLSHLEQSHFEDMILGWAVRSFASYSPAVFPRTDRPHEWEILIRVGGLMGGMTNEQIDIEKFDDGFFAGVVEKCGYDPTEVMAYYDEGGPERLVDFQIRSGPFGDGYGKNPDGLTLDSFKAEPDGIDMGPMVPRIDEVLHTPSGKVELAPRYITDDLTRLRGRLDRADEGLLLVSRRHIRSNNSWMHNVKVLVKGKDRCTLLIHPDDAAASGVADGAVANVSSEMGSIEVPVQISDEMMPGVVSLPHGWGHNVEGTQLSVAREFAGVNNNLLAIPTFVDEISGNAAVNGIPVEVRAGS